MKYAEPRPYADPEKAARRIVEIASTVEPALDGLELINGPFLFKDKGSPAEYGAGMKLAIERLAASSGLLTGGNSKITSAPPRSANDPLQIICSACPFQRVGVVSTMTSPRRWAANESIKHSGFHRRSLAHAYRQRP
jgi:hypothetical protein